MSLYKANVDRLIEHYGLDQELQKKINFRIHNTRFYQEVALKNSLGFGESYMQGQWDCDDLEELFFNIFRKTPSKMKKGIDFIPRYIAAKFFNLQNLKRSWKVNESHYDIGNELYERMLCSNMVYTCGYWEKAQNLAQAQIDKMELICRKLHLKEGMTLLDIGCGFGSFMKYAAENYGVKCVGITLSKKQLELAKERCKDLPIEVRLCDYRDLNGKYDRIVSIGMFEAVGYKNFSTYMDVVEKCLADDGIFLLHTIGNNVSTKFGESWSNKYIFPNGMLPSIAQIGKSIEGKFVLEDLHNFGEDYHKTLVAWHKNFVTNWDDLKKEHPHKYDDKFYRMWCFYLMSFAGGFKARRWQLWHLALVKPGRKAMNYRRGLD